MLTLNNKDVYENLEIGQIWSEYQKNGKLSTEEFNSICQSVDRMLPSIKDFSYHLNVRLIIREIVKIIFQYLGNLSLSVRPLVLEMIKISDWKLHAYNQMIPDCEVLLKKNISPEIIKLAIKIFPVFKKEEVSEFSNQCRIIDCIKELFDPVVIDKQPEMFKKFEQTYSFMVDYEKLQGPVFLTHKLSAIKILFQFSSDRMMKILQIFNEKKFTRIEWAQLTKLIVATDALLKLNVAEHIPHDIIVKILNLSLIKNKPSYSS